MKKYLWTFLFPILLIACSKSGNELSVEFTNFDGRTDYNPEKLSLEFSHKLKSSRLSINWEDNELIKFQPEIKSKIKLRGPNEILISPLQDFDPDTEYKISLNKKLISYFDSVDVVSKQEMKFTTAKLDLVADNMQWQTKSNGTTKDFLKLYTTFTYKVDPNELKSKCNFSIDTEKINYTIKNLTASARVIFELDINNYEKYSGKTLKLEIAKGLGIDKSEWKSKEIIEKEFIIPAIEELQITDVNLMNDNGSSFVSVYTNQMLNQEQDLKKLVTIKPDIDCEFSFTDYGFKVQADFKADVNYTIDIKKELISVYKKTLEYDYFKQISFFQTNPEIAFSPKDRIYLTNKGNKYIGVNIIGIDSVEIEIVKVYDNNVKALFKRGQSYDYKWNSVTDEYERFRYFRTNDIGDIVYEKTLKTKYLKSKGAYKVFEFDFEDMIKTPGIYILKVASPDSYSLQASQIVSLSDIGIITKTAKDDLLIACNSIENSEPLSGVKIEVISRKNQLITKASTGSDGVVLLEDFNKAPVTQEPALIIARKGKETNYLPIDGKFKANQYMFETRGATPGTYKAFFYGDRNLYRPGDSIVLCGIIRDKEMNNLKNVPIKVEIFNPQHREYKRFTLKLNDQGSFDHVFFVPRNAITGSYRAEFMLNDDLNLGSYYFSVEEFMPDRISVDLSTDKKEYKLTETLKLNGYVENLFGTVAADRKYEISLYAGKKRLFFEDFSDYRFVLESENYVNYFEADRERKGKTDENGKFSEEYNLYGAYKNNGILNLNFNCTAYDETGRTVNEKYTVELPTQDAFYGIKMFDSYREVNKKIKIPLMVVDKDGKRKNNEDINVQIVHITWHRVLKKNYNGKYRYESQKKETIVKESDFRFKKSSENYYYTPKKSGRYEVRVRAKNSETYVSYSFYAYWWGGWYDQSAEAFEIDREGKIKIEVEKESYYTGEKAKILFKAPFDGKMLVTLERNGIYHYEYIKTKNKSAAMTINLKDKYIPNVYVAAVLFRDLDDQSLPLTVAYGFKSIKVEKKDYKIDLEINAAEKSSSNTKQKITVKAKNIKDDVYVTLAAVDEGVLQISGYKTPNPYEYFYQKMSLNVYTHSIYKYLYPNIEFSTDKSGGGMMNDFKSMSIAGGISENPMANKRVKLLAKWSGIMKTNSRGEASYTLEIPQFSGAIRLMAVAHKDKSFGSTEKKMRIADDLVVSPSIPRFLSPGDEFNMYVNLSNTLNKKTTAKVEVKLAPGLELLSNKNQSIDIAANKEGKVLFRIKARKRLGFTKIDINTKAHGKEFKHSTDIEIRSAKGLIKDAEFASLAKGKSKDIDLAKDLYPKSVKSKVLISKTPLLDQLKHMDKLIKYPHGCIEQTTSKLFPQLYLTELMKYVDTKNPNPEKEIAFNINEGIAKLSSMQRYDGGFSYWPGGGYDSWWGSAYAGHFLIEAKNAGYNVSSNVLKKLFQYLKQKIDKAEKVEYYFYNGGDSYKQKYIPREAAYSAFVLALGDKINSSTLNYLKKNEKYLTQDSKFLLAGAFKIAGDNDTYKKLIKKYDLNLKSERSTGASFNSPIRDLALSLYVLTITDPQSKRTIEMAEALGAELKLHSFYSTQDMAFSVLALGKLNKEVSSKNTKGKVIVDGKTVLSLDKDLIASKDMSSEIITIKNTGQGNLFYLWQNEGISISDKDINEDSKIKVSREFYNKEGKLVKNKKFKKGDIIIVVVELEKFDSYSTIENIAITDLLPAGFEIENQRLNAYDMQNLLKEKMKWLKPSTPDYFDVRDDRINIYTGMRRNEKTMRFYYTVRAVSSGTFNLGSISASAMYDNRYRSFHSGGKIEIE